MAAAESIPIASDLSVTGRAGILSDEDIVNSIEREIRGGYEELLGALMGATALSTSSGKSATTNSSTSAGGALPEEGGSTVELRVPSAPQLTRLALRGLVENANRRTQSAIGLLRIVRERLQLPPSPPAATAATGQHHGNLNESAFSATQGALIMSHPSMPAIPPALGYSPSVSDGRSATVANDANPGSLTVVSASGHGANSPAAEPFSLSGTFGKVAFAEGSPHMTPNDTSHRVSRTASFARASSFSRKRQDGVDVVMLAEDSMSPDIGRAVNETWSMASRGSWRRRSTVAGSNGGHPHVVDIRRRSYLPIIALEGMPAFSLDDPGELRTRFSRKSTRHTAVFRPEGDLESLLDECDIPRIHDINSPEFNLFEEFRSYGEDAFTIVIMNVLLKYSFVTTLGLNVTALHAYVRCVRTFYRHNPFHNALHAADVVQTTHVYLCQRDVKENFTDVELLAVLFAAMIIDVAHLGVTNEFLAKTRHPLTKLYGESSPQECMHIALSFFLLDQEELDFFAGSTAWTAAKDVDFRYLVSTFILSSDSTKHSELLVAVDQLLSQGRINDEQVPQLLSAIVHAADMNYLAKPQHIYVEWAARYMAESFMQGDMERRYFAAMLSSNRSDSREGGGGEIEELLFFEVSKMCNRDAIDPAELQLSIVEYVALPYLTILRQVLPNVWFERLSFNYEFLREPHGQPAEAPARSRVPARPSGGCEGSVDPALLLEVQRQRRRDSDSGGGGSHDPLTSDEQPAQPSAVASAAFNEGIDQHIAEAVAFGAATGLSPAAGAADFFALLADWIGSSGGGGIGSGTGAWLEAVGQPSSSVDAVNTGGTQAGGDGAGTTGSSSSGAAPRRRSIPTLIADAHLHRMLEAGTSGGAGAGGGPLSSRSLGNGIEQQQQQQQQHPAAAHARLVNSVFAMCAELLKHVNALVGGFEGAAAGGAPAAAADAAGACAPNLSDGGAPLAARGELLGSASLLASPLSPVRWSAKTAARQFAVAWVAFLRGLEDVAQTRFLDHPRGSARSSPTPRSARADAVAAVVGGDDHDHAADDDDAAATDALQWLQLMCNQAAPHPHHRHFRAGGATAAADAATPNPNAPVGIAVLLTQLWWTVCRALDDCALLRPHTHPPDAPAVAAAAVDDLHATSFTTSPQAAPLHPARTAEATAATGGCAGAAECATRPPSASLRQLMSAIEDAPLLPQGRLFDTTRGASDAPYPHSFPPTAVDGVQQRLPSATSGTAAAATPEPFAGSPLRYVLQQQQQQHQQHQQQQRRRRRPTRSAS